MSQLRVFWLGLLLSSLLSSANAAELIGKGEYLADKSIEAEDAFRFARNRALADASEQASLLVESNVTLVKSGQQQWAKQEIRQLSATLLRVKDTQKSTEAQGQQTRYLVTVTADFDDAQQQTLQNYLADNQELRKQLQDLALEQAQLQHSIINAQQDKQMAASKQADIMNRERPQVLISRYEQKLLDTKSWVSEQQRRHLDIALQTVDMRQAIERNQKALAQERQRIATQTAAMQKAAQEQDAKQIANMRYISAQRIVRFVREHLPLTTDDIDIQPMNDTQVMIRYQLQWQMATADIERLCALFYEGNLAEQCRVNDNNTQVNIKIKTDLLSGLFQPFSEHKNVWRDPELTLFQVHDTTPKPSILIPDKLGNLTIHVSGKLPMVLKTPTTQAREKMANGQDLIGGKWQ